MKIAVCDDEKYYRKRIQDVIEENLLRCGVTDVCIDTFSSGVNFCDSAKEIETYHAIFLDISMPDINGLIVAQNIRKYNQNIVIVFITSYINYALDGYRMEAHRFIIKDMLEEMMPECIESLCKKINTHYSKKLFSFIEGEREILINRIAYIESCKHKLFFHMTGRNRRIFTMYDRLDRIENTLMNFPFIRIHKSYLVNYNCISEIGNYRVTLKSGDILPIPRDKYKKIKEQYYDLQGELI